ncbi:hypothetical protein [Vibrio fluminensis]|uniref:hypothetical protein n=1 Tax=Vibrio fluminensis TaxID=2783614 RepID=UPI001888B538|nr:hypothetical protein [Vibrio fluminensis]
MEPKEVRTIKRLLIKELPFYPNDKATLELLQEMSINDVIFHYLHWQSRHIPSRSRKVILAPELTSDRRWKAHKQQIEDLLGLVRSGASVTPFLSERAHNNGYTPFKDTNSKDKDLILNSKGFHHLHLSMDDADSGLAKRTDVVLFAFVTRSEFYAIALFDHGIFDNLNHKTSEHNRLEQLAGKYYCAPKTFRTVSGHGVYLRHLSDIYAQCILEYTPKINERVYVNRLYSDGSLALPNKFKLEWRIVGLDLELLDKKTGKRFLFRQGPM